MIQKFDERRSICTGCGDVFETSRGHVCGSYVPAGDVVQPDPVEVAAPKKKRRRRRRTKRVEKVLPPSPPAPAQV